MAETYRVMFFHQIDEYGYRDHGFIISVRKTLNLGQREAAEIFFGGFYFLLIIFSRKWCVLLVCKSTIGDYIC